MAVVAQHIGDNGARCISLNATDGMERGMDAVDTGGPITVPVGDKCLGRIFNLLGQPIDEKPAPEGVERWPIHRQPPSFEEQETSTEILETGIKVVDLIAPYAKGGKIGLFGGADIQGAVLVNAVTGESQYYEEVPNWVDHVYDANLIMEQYDYYGMYHNGFINSIFGQRDVTHTTEGYNYIAIGDDVYMYTGVTSVTSDQSNIGFILSNQRTKETHFYSVAGATEASAQASAMSQVQQMRYVATFPLLLNIADQPTYFMSLKGEDGLVKMYAMVNVQQYNIVETGSTVAECEANYRRALADSGLISDGDAEAVPSDQEEISGAIAEIRTAVLDGNSYYFLRLEGQDTFYAVNAAENPLAVILNAGDQVTIAYTAGEGGGILSGTSVARAGETPVTFTPEEAPADAPAETGQPAEDAASSNQPT